MLATDRYSPLGEKHSISVKDLLKRPHGVWQLHARQLPTMLEEFSSLVRRATDVRDALAHRIPGPLRVSGRPLKEVRGLLRLDVGSGFDFDQVASRLPKGDHYGRRRLLADLVTDGWVIQDKPDHWIATDKARKLQTTTRGRLTRARAQVVLTELLERVQAVNAEPTYAFKVDVAVLFGSYLSDIPRIGDVDVAVRLRERGRSKEEQKRLEDSSHDRAGGRVATIFDHLGWPRKEVIAALKARQPTIDLRELTELEAMMRQGTTLRYEVLFGYWNPPGADEQIERK